VKSYLCSCQTVQLQSCMNVWTDNYWCQLPHFHYCIHNRVMDDIAVSNEITVLHSSHPASTILTPFPTCSVSYFYIFVPKINAILTLHKFSSAHFKFLKSVTVQMSVRDNICFPSPMTTQNCHKSKVLTNFTLLSYTSFVKLCYQFTCCIDLEIFSVHDM